MPKSRRRRRMPVPHAEDPLSVGLGDKRKLRQLCRQVERAMVTALADVDDDVLLTLTVTAVLPWPNASRLLVAVFPDTPSVDRDRILERLAEHKGALRAVATEAIHRKRTPELCFEVLQPSD